MSAAKLRVGVVGLSQRVERQVLPALAASPRAEIAALCSRDLAKAEALASRYPGCRAFGAFAEFVACDGLDAVFVMTPHEHHAEVSLAALEAGRHVMCEKPLATSLADATAMAERARHHRLRTAVNFTYRSTTAMRVIAGALADPGIGAPIHLDFAYLQSRGLLGRGKMTSTLYDTGSHLVDLLLWWSNAEPIAVRAVASSEHAEGQWTVIVELAGGATATLHASRLALGHSNAIRARLQGHRGALTLAFDTDAAIVRHAGSSEPSEWRTIDPPPELLVSYADFPRFHFDRLVGALLGEEPFPDFEQGLRVQRVLEAARESAGSGRRIAVP